MTGLLCTEPRAVLILGTGYLGKSAGGEPAESRSHGPYGGH